MRILLLIILLLGAAGARENPFKPVIDETVLPVTSNKVEKAPPFKKTEIRLPVDARILTSVAIYYQALDGSIKKEIVAVDRSVDWHKPIVVSQGLPCGETKKRNSKKSPKAAKGKAVKKKTARPKAAAAAKPAAKKGPKPSPAATKGLYRPLPFLGLKFEERSLRIVTPDEKIRIFHLADPFKVVIDFKRDAAFLSRHKKIAKPPFMAVDVGNHEGYYRLVVTLDGPYRYSLSKIADGYILYLR